ncbi:MAG: hypothetical protein ACK5FU_03420 [Bacteroidota bacterium]|jgi:hypothetical protein|nr:hypothetical protein [Sphingobacteriales bacterium]
MKALVPKPANTLGNIFKATGIILCLLIIDLSNSNAFRFLLREGKRKSRPEKSNSLPTVELPDVAKKLKQSFR